MATASTSVLDPASPAFAADPHPVFDALRSEAPVVRDPLGWSTIDYATSEASFHDPALVPGIDHLLVSRGIEPLWGTFDRTLTDAEGDVHQRLRRAVSPWFSARRIAELRERTRTLATTIVADAGGSMDVMADLADVVPSRLFCWMVGAPDADAEPLARLSKRLLSVFTATTEMVDPVRAAKAELGAFTDDLLRARTARPGQDVTSALLAATSSGALAVGDAFHLLEELLSAAVDNTANTTALAAFTLAERPAAWAAVHDDQSLVPATVEECGRFEPAIRHTIKAVVAPTVVGGIDVEPGEFVTVRVAAANRDPAVFDRPHEVDIRRVRPRTQLAFGAGRHYCLGAALGRTEVAEMLAALTSAWPVGVVAAGVDMDCHTSGIVRTMPLERSS